MRRCNECNRYVTGPDLPSGLGLCPACDPGERARREGRAALEARRRSLRWADPSALVGRTIVRAEEGDDGLLLAECWLTLGLDDGSNFFVFGTDLGAWFQREPASE